MSKKIQILTVLYLLISGITTLVMLVTSFEMANEKYFPAFLMSQKFTLPVILSAMGLGYITFFDSDQYKNKIVVNIFLLFFTITFCLFAYYVVTLDKSKVTGVVMAVFVVQLLVLISQIFTFLTVHSSSK